MVVVVLGSLGYPPLVSKAVISMYLCFFPVAIGMVKGALALIVYTVRAGVHRIISARKANRRERKTYSLQTRD